MLESMLNANVNKIREGLVLYGYEELYDLKDLTFPTFPTGIPLVYSLEDLINHPSIRFNRDSVLVFEYLAGEGVTSVPLVNPNVADNLFQFYCLDSVYESETHIVGLINGIPCFSFHVSVEGHDNTEFHWLETPITMNVSPGYSEAFWCDAAKRKINMEVDDSFFGFFAPESVTELFNQGFTYKDTTLMVSSLKFFGSATVPKTVWRESLKLASQPDYLAILERKPLDSEELRELSNYITQESTSKLLIGHQHFTDDVANHIADNTASPILLKYLAGSTTSSDILRKTISSPHIDMAGKAVAVNNSVFPADLLPPLLDELPLDIARPLMLKRLFPVSVFANILHSSRLHPCFGLIPELVRELLNSPEGTAILEESLIQVGVAPVDSEGVFPRETLELYAMDVFYRNKPVIKRTRNKGLYPLF